MKAKITMSFLAIIIFAMPLQNALFPQYADAFILSKLFSATSKKMAKETIKDMTIETAANFALNEAFKIAGDASKKYDIMDNYTLICATALSPAGECSKPLQVKGILTEADKIAVGTQAEIELENLITNGKGFSRWQKWLDWLAPIWLLSFGATALTYALDSDTRSLFNEVGYNTLVALGLIKPVTENKPFSMDTYVDQGTATPQPTEPSTDNAQNTKSGTSTFFDNSYATNFPNLNSVVVAELLRSPNEDLTQFRMDSYYGSSTNFIGAVINNNGSNVMNFKPFNYGTTTLTVNDEQIPYPNGLNQQNVMDIPLSLFPEWAKTQTVVHRTPYLKDDGFYYQDYFLYTSNGHKYGVHHKQTMANLPGFIRVNSRQTTEISTLKTINLIVHKNATDSSTVPFTPSHETMTEVDITKQSSQIDRYDRISVMPPSAIPIKQTSTGIELTPLPNKDTDEIKYITPDGTVVPEEDITVGDPNVTKDPQGVPQVTPPATSTNPNPQPITLAPPSTPAPIKTDAPIFPEGESCSVGLKLPKISPLAYAVSESFPFSIPFDLYDGFQAIFSEMGNEKPEFNYKLSFMGEQQEWKITIPTYFDSWKRFTDSFLIFVFDVGIIFMIFRFMGGSK